jgi:PAS domain S-box-containing protein
MESRDIRTGTDALLPELERSRPHPAGQKTPEQHATTMLETVPDGVFNLDREWRFLYVNCAAERILGRERQTLLGRVFWEEIPGALATPVESELRRALKNQTTGEFQARFDGVAGLYQILTCPCEDGLLVFMRDITEQNRLREALEESEAWRRLIIQNVKDFAIFSMDPEGRVTLWNPGAEKMFGYAANEVLGQPADRIYVPEDRAAGVARLELAQAKEKGSARDERWHLRKDGGRLYLSGAVVPLYDDGGRLRGFTKVARDISERKKLEDELYTARENLEKTVSERTQKLQETISELEVFSYSLSHDLRTPLRAMRSFAQLLSRTAHEKLDPRSNEYVERILRGAERLDQLIQDVLDYSRVSRGEIKREPIDLDKLVHDIIGEQPALEPSKAEIHIESPLLEVIGHKASLSQSISNLLANALKFVPKGKFPKVRIWTEPQQSRVRLWIADNGIGIGKEYQERIFGMFQRASTDPQYEGTGIGLAVVRKAIERMGGQSGVESEVGQGSRFWIELPGKGQP